MNEAEARLTLWRVAEALAPRDADEDELVFDVGCALRSWALVEARPHNSVQMTAAGSRTASEDARWVVIVVARAHGRGENINDTGLGDDGPIGMAIDLAVAQIVDQGGPPDGDWLPWLAETIDAIGVAHHSAGPALRVGAGEHHDAITQRWDAGNRDWTWP